MYFSDQIPDNISPEVLDGYRQRSFQLTSVGLMIVTSFFIISWSFFKIHDYKVPVKCVVVSYSV